MTKRDPNRTVRYNRFDQKKGQKESEPNRDRPSGPSVFAKSLIHKALLFPVIAITGNSDSSGLTLSAIRESAAALGLTVGGCSRFSLCGDVLGVGTRVAGQAVVDPSASCDVIQRLVSTN